MISFSSWNGVKDHANSMLITDVLKGELGFKGFTVSDWAGIEQISTDYPTAVRTAINAGIDMAMEPNDYKRFISTLRDEVSAGRVPQSRIDDAVTRILTQKFALGLFTKNTTDRSYTAQVGSAAHRAVARQAVRESMVLLKNNAVLPLSKTATYKIVVGGSHVDDLGLQMGGLTISWQGSAGATTTGTTFWQALQAARPPNVTLQNVGTATGGTYSGDVGIAVIGEQPYAEGVGDSATLAVSSANATQVDDICSRTTTCLVILISGRPLIVNTQLSRATAFVAAWLPGSEGAGLIDPLFGDFPFTGKLPVTWPNAITQEPINDGDGQTGLFPFGFGLRDDGLTPTPTSTAATPSSTATTTPTAPVTRPPPRTAIPVTATSTATPSSALPALVQSAVLDTSGTTGSVGFPNSVASGDLLIAAVRIGDQTGASTVTDNNGNAWQLVDRRTENGSGIGDALELWYAPNASNAPNARPTVSIRSSVSTATLRVVLAEYSGVLAASGALDQHATASGNSAAATASTSMTAQANELVIGYAEVAGTSTFTPGPGYLLGPGAQRPVPGRNPTMRLPGGNHRPARRPPASRDLRSQARAIGIATFQKCGRHVDASQHTDDRRNRHAHADQHRRDTQQHPTTPKAIATPDRFRHYNDRTQPHRQPCLALVQSDAIVGPTSGTTGSVGFPNSGASGDLLIAAVHWRRTGASTVTDPNNGNAWQRDRSAHGEQQWQRRRPRAVVRPERLSTRRMLDRPSASGLGLDCDTARRARRAQRRAGSSGALDQHATASWHTVPRPQRTRSMTAQANELVIGYAEVAGTSTFTPGPGYILGPGAPASGARKLTIAYLVTTTAGPQTASFGISSQAWAIGIATFRSAP